MGNRIQTVIYTPEEYLAKGACSTYKRERDLRGQIFGCLGTTASIIPLAQYPARGPEANV